jgi:phosphate/sulfate permease
LLRSKKAAMISPLFSHLLIPFIVAMFLAINMGGSGTAPSFSAAYGANIIRRLSIPGLFGICVFAGAILAGKKVSMTMGRDLVDPESMTLVITTIVLFSIAMSLFFANMLSVPQSTSQSSVFSLLAVALYFGRHDFRLLLTGILPVWFILPVISFLLTLGICKIYSLLKEHWKGLKQFEPGPYTTKILVLLSACYVAFSIGANNVANAAGPIAGMMVNELGIDASDEKSFTLIAIMATLLIAPCFAIGSSLMGFRIVNATGKGIVQFGEKGAIVISLVTASLLLLASVTKGIPTSLVQLNTFAIIAFSISKTGWKRTVWHGTLHKFWLVWLVAPAFAFLLCYALLNMAGYYGLLFYY